jgi:hypothetical protein
MDAILCMDAVPSRGPIGIPRGRLLRVDDGAGMVIRVWEGEVWVTEEDSGQDHMLQAGQEFRLGRRGAAIAHAFRRSVISLVATASGIAPRRVALL